ncbi:hypothetical protein IMG5_000760 [Ichthyophthirius multifiliis]|uniref:FCP1 homology domain-containing protein n=1 Tax=Ichthyophthirius multifiliis TaxID=5932 RepID=G0QIW3_ICHMU|nr:hypothetical protein IMG5_000760 [Ichthyophthirius multifiliis]EGR34848.1 hypothetical protein IMG5_000760 [Ichthyophthirius multifiliis]|eukprot:XP_004040152.1 hypothetical protein IMG5_000760 [Ichthyophthirius multifiliis]
MIEKPYTLILDLDETLGHFNQQKQQFVQRPYLQEFLNDLSKFYELIIFTAGIKEYADQTVTEFDKNKLIQHKLYRQHCQIQGLVYIKDLSRVGRDLKKTIILDNNHHNFQQQPDNAIFVKSWFDDKEDDELLFLKKILISKIFIQYYQLKNIIEIAESKTKDVRKSLQKYRDFIVRQISQQKNI